MLFERKAVWRQCPANKQRYHVLAYTLQIDSHSIMSRLDKLPFRTSILPQAAGFGLLLYGMATGASATVAVGVILTGVYAAASRKKDVAGE